MTRVNEPVTATVGADPVLPSQDDEVVAASSEGVGGVAGSRVLPGWGWWTPVRAVIVLAAVAYAAGYLMRLPCHGEAGFVSDGQYPHMCYSDIAFLYQLRGFANGFLPYLQLDPSGEALEYPVLTGGFMWLASLLTGTGGDEALRALRFYDINAVLLAACWIAAVVCTTLTHRHRPWDGAMLALAPVVALTALINWDLLAVALTAGFLLASSRSRPVLAGLLLGLAVSAKFYPLLLLGPLLLVCWRTRRWGDFWRTTAATAVSWLAVNLPIYLAAPEGWWRFYRFSSERGEDWGSVWLAVSIWNHGVDPARLNLYAVVALAVCCAAIAVLAWVAPEPPRLAQLGFLVIAAFCLTNKVYSPQYVLWLVPFAVLARPRWRDLLVWQLGEVIYFVSIWLYLEGYNQPDNKGLPESWYSGAIVVHVLATLYLCAVIVRDVLRPEHDPVREPPPPVRPAGRAAPAAPGGPAPPDAIAGDDLAHVLDAYRLPGAPP